MGWIEEVSAERLVFIFGSIILCVLIVSVTSCTVNANYKAESLLKAGYSATEIDCAIYLGQDLENACAKASIVSVSKPL